MVAFLNTCFYPMDRSQNHGTDIGTCPNNADALNVDGHEGCISNCQNFSFFFFCFENEYQEKISQKEMEKISLHEDDASFKHTLI